MKLESTVNPKKQYLVNDTWTGLEETCDFETLKSDYEFLPYKTIDDLNIGEETEYTAIKVKRIA
jgi:hypothetical protein